MGDRTYCTLEVWGVTTRTEMDAIYNAIKNWERIWPEDAKKSFEEERETIGFDEVNYGSIDTDLEKALIDSGLGYCWEWGTGGDYNAGFEMRDMAGNSWAYSIADGEIMLSLSQALDEEVLKEAKACRDAMQESKSPLIVVNSAHEKIEAIKKLQETKKTD